MYGLLALAACTSGGPAETSLSIASVDLPGCAGQYDDPLDEYVYAIDRAKHKLVQINPRSCTLGRTIGLGSSPSEAAVTGSGRWIYVGDALDHTLTVVSQERDEVELVIDLGFAPDELLFEPAHTVLWVSEHATGRTVLVESEHHTVVDELWLEPGASGLASTDALPQTMLAAHPDGFIQVIDAALRTEIARVDTGGPSLAMHHASNTSDLYVCVGGDDPALLVVPTTGPSAFLVSSRIELQAPCTGLRFNGFRYGLALQPSLDMALAIDTESDAVAASVPVGAAPDVVVLNGTVGAVGNQLSGDVSLVSLTDLTEFARPVIGVGGETLARRLQDGLDPNFVYAHDPADGTLTTIDLRDGSVRLAVQVGEIDAMVVAGPKGGKCH